MFGTHQKITTNLDIIALSVLAFLAFPVAVAAPLQAWVPPLLAALLILRPRLKNYRLFVGNHPRVVYIFSLVVAWSCIGCSWSIDFQTSLFATARLVLIFFALVILINAAQNLTEKDRQIVQLWLRRGGLIGIYMALGRAAVILFFLGMDVGYTVTYDTASLLFQNASLIGGFNETTVIISLFCFPTVLSIASFDRNLTAFVYVVLILLMLLLLAPLAVLLSFLAGVAIFWISQYSVYYSALLVKLCISGYLIFIVYLHDIGDWITNILLAGFTLPNEALHRLSIWQFSAKNIAERPFHGYGLNTSRIFPGADLEIILSEGPSGVTLTGPAMPLHPHSALLQIWLELGGIGVVLAVALLYITITGISKATDVRVAAAAMAVVATAFTLTQLSFGIWQGWLIGALGTVTILTQVFMGPLKSYNPNKM